MPTQIKIISLIPSATEIVCSLGFQDSLVGRSHECDYPVFVRKLPACTEPNIDVNASSSVIDQQVKDHLQQGLSIYKVHADLIEQLKPDIIITQSHCAVCAATTVDIEKALGRKLSSIPKIISLNVQKLDDLWKSIQQIADALGSPKAGEEKIEKLKGQMSAITQKAKAIEDRPTVAAIEWIEPLMAAGNWIPELIEMAGGKNLFGKAGEHSPWLKWEEVSQKNPDVILILPCGFDLERTRREIKPLVMSPGWLDLTAVQNNRVFILDGNQYFNRPGPRLVGSLEILAEVLHPEYFDFNRKYDGWEYLGIAPL